MNLNLASQYIPSTHGERTYVPGRTNKNDWIPSIKNNNNKEVPGDVEKLSTDAIAGIMLLCKVDSTGEEVFQEDFDELVAYSHAV